ncbi:MAG: class II aldolase/adducin family protein [Xanthobacteraceae bacterium]
MTDALRAKLVDAGRVLGMEGHGDYVAGHISVRLPGEPGRFLMKPAGIGIEEMRPDNIITVDLEGRKTDGAMPRHNEVYIHSEVLRARDDVQCVIHSHPMHAVAFSSLGKPLAAVGNSGGYFADGRLSVFSETTDLIVSAERGRAVARCLGGNAALILRNHGIVATGGGIEEAVWTAIKLEKACQLQLLAESAGGPKLLAEGEDLMKKRQRGNRPDLHANTFGYLVRKWRCLCCGEIVPASQVTTFENTDQK